MLMGTMDEILAALLRIELLLTNQPGSGTKRKPAKKNELTPASVLWSEYARIHEEMYGVPAPRNASINGMLATVARRVPEADLALLVQFFFRQTDAWYLREMHHVRCLVRDCEMLLTRMRSGVVITPGKAKQIEQTMANADASRAYLEGKHGRKKDRSVSGSATAGDETDFPDSQ